MSDSIEKEVEAIRAGIAALADEFAQEKREAAEGFVVTGEMVDAVLDWRELQKHTPHQRALIPSLRARFGIDVHEAVKVCCDPRITHPQPPAEDQIAPGVWDQSSFDQPEWQESADDEGGAEDAS